MAVLINLTGHRFGRLVVACRDGATYPVRWIARCDCGRVTSTYAGHLRNGTARSCGCWRREARLKDLSGQIFGRWMVLRRAPPRRWICRCACGTERAVGGPDLTAGKSQSCGCLNRETAKFRHVTHGLRYAPEWWSWQKAKQRCHTPTDKNWPDYGGRGITMCQEWRDSFAAFYAHVGPRPTPKHTIDRINNSGNYEPGNLRWATRAEQSANRRRVSE